MGEVVAGIDGVTGSESLQHIAMVLSPWFSIVGCAALIIPFAWSFGYFKSKPDEHVNTMLSKARSCTVLALAFLAVGFVLGVWGRYKEFGPGAGQMFNSVFNLPLIPLLLAASMVLCFSFYRSKASLGILTALADWIADLSRIFCSGSPPPFFAATIISLAARLKSFPRLASVAAFLCFIVDHLECPDISCYLSI